MSKPIDEAVIRAQLGKTLGDTSFPELGEKSDVRTHLLNPLLI